LEAGQTFHWAIKEDYIRWFTGKEDRHKRTEVILQRLVKQKKLVAKKYGKRLIYCVPRSARNQNYEHGLACTYCLVNVWRSRMDGMIIAERFFKGLGAVPEWGIRYPNGKLLMLEFCTQQDYEHYGRLKTKIRRYQNNLYRIEEKFKASGIIIFVIDVDRTRIESFIESNFPEGPFFFTDYKTFREVAIGNYFKAPIYIWGQDGKEYPLS